MKEMVTQSGRDSKAGESWGDDVGEKGGTDPEIRRGLDVVD